MSYSIDNKNFVIDTSILIEYLNKDSPYDRIIRKLYEYTVNGVVKLYSPSIVLSETYYIASRIYRALGLTEPNRRAYEYIVWLTSYLGLNVEPIDHDLAMMIGELKKTLHISIVDCSVIALAMKLDAIPLFLKIEKEMKTGINMLRKYNVVYIDELSI